MGKNGEQMWTNKEDLFVYNT